MAKVRNLTGRSVPLLRWRILPNSDQALNPAGEVVDYVPDVVSYSPQAKRLADQGILWIQGYTKLEAKEKTDDASTGTAEEKTEAEEAGAEEGTEG